MKITCTCLFFLLLATACHTNADKTKAPPVKIDTASYYPIADFFRKQAEYVDLRNFVIQYSHTLDGKKDSSQLTKEQFLTLGERFIDQGKKFRQKAYLYKEAVFEDLSTKSFTFTYAPVEQVVSGIQNVDVLLDDITHTAKRVFIKTILTTGDTTVTEQYSWKAFAGFQLTRYKTAGTAYSSSEVISVNWNKTQ